VRVFGFGTERTDLTSRGEGLNARTSLSGPKWDRTVGTDRTAGLIPRGLEHTWRHPNTEQVARVRWWSVEVVGAFKRRGSPVAGSALRYEVPNAEKRKPTGPPVSASDRGRV
jgi:hypothetical protein